MCTIRIKKVQSTITQAYSFAFNNFPGYFGADDIHGIVILCNKCAEAGGKKTRSDKRVTTQESGIPTFID
jgi:hypothetical protein